VNITEFAPRSVKSDGDFPDILGEKTPAVWRSRDGAAVRAAAIDEAAAVRLDIPAFLRKQAD